MTSNGTLQDGSDERYDVRFRKLAMSLAGHKRRFRAVRGVSAFTLIPAVARLLGHFAEGPKGDETKNEHRGWVSRSVRWIIVRTIALISAAASLRYLLCSTSLHAHLAIEHSCVG